MINLVAASLLARDHATVVPFDSGRHGATMLARADGDGMRSKQGADVDADTARE
jgi:hypothetical protein